MGGGWVTRLTSLGHVTGEETMMVHINTQLKTSMGGGGRGGMRGVNVGVEKQ